MPHPEKAGKRTGPQRGPFEGVRTIKVDSANPDPEAIRYAASRIRAGGLVAFPTETVYGLGANAFDEEAVARIFEAKRRPASDPIIVHIAEMSQLSKVAADVPDEAKRFAERFWPGPLTLILRRGNLVPGNVSSGLPTVAVRMPSHPVALALIRAAGVPVAAPSANLFSRPSPTLARHVEEDFREGVDVILDGGPATIGVESTVLDLTSDPPVVLRPGGTPLEALRELDPRISYVARYAKHAEGVQSPGQLTKHYSSKAKLILFTGDRERALEAMRVKAEALLRGGAKVGVMAPRENAGGFRGDIEIAVLGEEGDLEAAAASLFASMRSLDAKGVGYILVRGVETTGLGLAILDRLIRAAEGKVVEA